MKKLNEPRVFVPILILAVLALLVSAGRFKKMSTARDSIYLDEKDQKEMTEAFRDGSAYEGGATVPTPPAAPAPPPGQ